MNYTCGFWSTNKVHCWGDPTIHKPYKHCIVCGIDKVRIEIRYE